MRKLMIVTVLGALTALAQARSSQAQTGQTKVIQDPGEYSAYASAFGMQDPVQKAAALESFLQQYPGSVVKSDALQLLLSAYGAKSNQPKLEETAMRILNDNPGDVRALAVATVSQRAKGTPQSVADAGANAQKGLQALANWTKPEGMTDADFTKLKDEMAEVFDGASAFAALQSKDYATARDHYLKSVEKDPSNLQDTYQLAVAELEMTPMDLHGFWYGAKALALAADNPDTVKAIAPYIKGKYRKYHGKLDDWDKFAAKVAGQTTPPADMAELISPAPTPCDLAVQAVKDNKPEDLSMSDWEFVLAHANCSPANKDAADKVWQVILDKQKTPEGTPAKLKLPAVLVVSATADKVQAAITEENQCQKKAEIEVLLTKPVLHPPAPGTTIEVVGAMTRYRPEPFLFTMEQGTLKIAKPATLDCPVPRAGK